MDIVRRPAIVAALLAAALVAWIVTAQRMRGMDAGPGTDLGAFGWFMGIWVTMMAGMTLPSAVPAVAMFAGLRPGAPAWAFAGVYQLTPLKNACLRHCRAPIGFLLRGGLGRTGAVRTGLGHGAYCIGCCAGLMLALFALGVMSLVWMAAVAALILVEKVLPRGEAFARAAAVGLVAAGVWVAVAPGSVPGLTQPGGAGMTPMQMEESP